MNRSGVRPRRVPFVVLVVVAVLVTACAGGSGAPAPATGAPQAKVETQFKLRGASNLGKDTADGKAYELFATCLGEKTNGLIELKHFHAASLGSDAETLELAQTGALDFVVTSLYSSVIPVATVFDLPFLWNDYAHWLKGIDGPVGKTVKDAAAGTRIKILDFHLGGWRDVYTTKKKLETAEDFKGLKLRTQQTPAWVQLFQALGAVPTPLAFGEVYLALQQGTLDGAETALPAMWDVKHYEVSKYVAQTHHGLSTNAWVISEQTWNKLPKGAQDAVVECSKTAVTFQRTQKLADAERIDKALQDEKKMVFTKPDPAPFRAAAQQVYAKLVTADAQKALVKQVQDLAK